MGLPISMAESEIERRAERSLVSLPGGRLAWFALTVEAADRLGIEDRLLGSGLSGTFGKPSHFSGSRIGSSF